MRNKKQYTSGYLAFIWQVHVSVTSYNYDGEILGTIAFTIGWIKMKNWSLLKSQIKLWDF